MRVDTDASLPEFEFGTTLRILQELFLPDSHIFLEKFREYMRSVQPVPVAHHRKDRDFVFKEVYSCFYVFLRIMSSKKQ